MQSVVGASSFPSHEGRVGCRDWTRTWGVAWCSVLSEWRALKLHDSPSAGTRPRAVDRRALAGHRRGPGTECPRPEPHTSDLKPLAKQTRLQEWEDTEWNCVLLPRWPGGGSPRMGLGGSTCGWAHVCQSQKDVEPPLLVRHQGTEQSLTILGIGKYTCTPGQQGQEVMRQGVAPGLVTLGQLSWPVVCRLLYCIVPAAAMCLGGREQRESLGWLWVQGCFEALCGVSFSKLGPGFPLGNESRLESLREIGVRSGRQSEATAPPPPVLPSFLLSFPLSVSL